MEGRGETPPARTEHLATHGHGLPLAKWAISDSEDCQSKRPAGMFEAGMQKSPRLTPGAMTICTTLRASRAPERRHPVIVADLLVAGAVGPIPALMPGIFGRALELPLPDVDLVALERRIVAEQRPRQRVVVLADAHETAETHDRVGDLAAELVDHDALDLADPVAVRTVDRRSLHLVAADETDGFALVECPPLGRCRHDASPCLDGYWGQHAPASAVPRPFPNDGTRSASTH